MRSLDLLSSFQAYDQSYVGRAYSSLGSSLNHLCYLLCPKKTFLHALQQWITCPPRRTTGNEGTECGQKICIPRSPRRVGLELIVTLT